MLLRVAMVVLTGEASTVTAASADANAVRAMANGAPLVATNRTGNTFTLSRKGYYGRMAGHNLRRTVGNERFGQRVERCGQWKEKDRRADSGMGGAREKGERQGGRD